MSALVVWRGSAIKMPGTAAEVEALVAEAEAELIERAARAVCRLCAAGSRPTHGLNGWEHAPPPGRCDPLGCDAAKVRDLA